MGDAIESLKRQLETHRMNLHKLEERAAFYGPLDVPLKLQNQIELEKKNIARLEEEVARCKGGVRRRNALKELEVWYQKAVQAMLDGRWATAIKYLRQVVARDPLYKNAAELLRQAELRQEERERVLIEPMKKALRDPVFQGIGAIVAVLAFLVAIGTWFWPDIRTVLFPTTPAATLTPTVMATNLTDARVRFTITHSNGGELEVHAGGTLTLTPGEGVLIETIITVGQLSFPRDLTYQYLAPRGSIPEGFAGPRTSYVAPDQPGPDFITVLITDPETGSEILRSINVTVKEKSP